MKFCQWYETTDEEVTYDDPEYFFIFGMNSKNDEVYNHIELKKSMTKIKVFVERERSGLVKKWIDSRIKNGTVVPFNENIFDRFDNDEQKRIITGIFDDKQRMG